MATSAVQTWLQRLGGGVEATKLAELEEKIQPLGRGGSRLPAVPAFPVFLILGGAGLWGLFVVWPHLALGVEALFLGQPSGLQVAGIGTVVGAFSLALGYGIHLAFGNLVARRQQLEWLRGLQLQAKAVWYGAGSGILGQIKAFSRLEDPQPT